MQNRSIFSFIFLYLIARLLEYFITSKLKWTQKDVDYDQAARIEPTHQLLVFHNMAKPTDLFYDLRKALKHYS